MNIYHVVTFDHFRAAETMYDDLRMLQVRHVSLHKMDRPGKSDGGVVKVRVPVEDGITVDAHRTAVGNLSLGRGSHTIERVTDDKPNLVTSGPTPEELSALLDGNPWKGDQ